MRFLAAGVTAIDGNHRLAGGLWGEVRDSLYAHYGGPQAVATGSSRNGGGSNNDTSLGSRTGSSYSCCHSG